MSIYTAQFLYRLDEAKEKATCKGLENHKICDSVFLPNTTQTAYENNTAINYKLTHICSEVSFSIGL